jgi:hypothetical protein
MNAFKPGDHVVVRHPSGSYYSAVVERAEPDGVYVVCRDPARGPLAPAKPGDNKAPRSLVYEDDILRMI